MAQRWIWLLTLLLGVAGGILLAGGWHSSRESHVPRDPVENARESRPETLRAETEVTRLLRSLERESAERRALELELQVLRDRLANVENSLSVERTTRSEGQASRRVGTLRHFDQTKLLEQGFGEALVADIQQRYEQNRLEILELRDRATREAWVDSPRFEDEVIGLERGLRNQLGPDDYDVLLYATGEPNRVVLQRVIEGSSAADAGLEADDVVVRYAGREIFRPGDLLAATSAGQAGEMVEIAVTRAEQRQHFRIRRGPLGVTVRRVSRVPESW